jgi:hypothetical protein
MNKYFLLTLFTFVIFSSIALADSCNFCYTKNLNCPATVYVGKLFNISFEYKQTGPTYPFDYFTLLIDDGIVSGFLTNSTTEMSDCQWNKYTIKTLSPIAPGNYTYTVKSYASDSIDVKDWEMEDDSISCVVNVV